jgi:PRD1 phage membrane DNA delivery
MDRAFETIVTIASGIIGVAILAVLVSNKANTAGVLGAAGSAFSNALSAATGPVTGSVAPPVNTATGGAAQLFGNFQLPSLGVGVY